MRESSVDTACVGQARRNRRRGHLALHVVASGSRPGELKWTMLSVLDPQRLQIRNDRRLGLHPRRNQPLQRMPTSVLPRPCVGEKFQMQYQSLTASLQPSLHQPSLHQLNPRKQNLRQNQADLICIALITKKKTPPTCPLNVNYEHCINGFKSIWTHQRNLRTCAISNGGCSFPLAIADTPPCLTKSAGRGLVPPHYTSTRNLLPRVAWAAGASFTPFEERRPPPPAPGTAARRLRGAPPGETEARFGMRMQKFAHQR